MYLFNRLLKRSFYWNVCLVVLCLPVVILIRFVNAILKLRLVYIRADRIGSFGPDGAEAVIRHDLQEAGTRTYYYFATPPVNGQWAKMLSRHLPIRNFLAPIGFTDLQLGGQGVFTRSATKTRSRDPHGMLYQTEKAQLPFTEAEDAQCRAWLRSHGVGPDDKFVCLLCRDDQYLTRTKQFSAIDFSYHDYRNSKIESFFPTISYLNERGVWVIRMGWVMREDVQFSSPRVIDFSSDPHKSHLLDVWLYAHCDACISTGTGPDTMANIYRNPTLFVNFMPLGILHDYHRTMSLPKHLSSKANGKPLPLSSYIEANFYFSEDYEKAGIVITDLTPEEILEAGREFWEIFLEGKSRDLEQERLQARFWETFLAHPSYQTAHNWKHPDSAVGSNWLASQKDGFFD